MLLAFLSLVNEIGNYTLEKTKKFLDIIHSTSKEGSNLLENLYNGRNLKLEKSPATQRI